MNLHWLLCRGGSNHSNVQYYCASSKQMHVSVHFTCSINSGVSAIEGAGMHVLKSLEARSGHSELLLQVSAVEECSLSGVYYNSIHT